MPVKLSDDLVTLTRAEAEASSRSIAAQVEHRARVGRAAERVLLHATVDSLLTCSYVGDDPNYEPKRCQEYYEVARDAVGVVVLEFFTEVAEGRWEPIPRLSLDAQVNSIPRAAPRPPRKA